ncbi:UbiA prenyltransferase family protein [bacterium]|nr:UbiA prenyltransferase family protein [bacterium]
MLKLIQKIENTPINFYSCVLSLLCLIIARVLIENWLGAFSGKNGMSFFYHLTYNLLFFFTTYLLFIEIIKRFLKISLKKTANVLLWGYLIILFPPLIDYFISHGRGFLSFYGLYGLRELTQRFFTFFGDSPEFGITYGVRVEVAITMLFVLIYAYIKNRSIVRSLFLSLFVYFTLFMLSTFPSWITIVIDGFSKGFLTVNEMDIAKMFLTPVKLFSQKKGSFLNALSIKMSLIYSLVFTAIISAGLFSNYKEKFLAFLKNSRLPQLVYHGGMLCAGAGLGIIFTHPIWEVNFFNIVAFLVVLLAVCLAWMASVTVNDIADRKIDKETNKKRPLIKNIFTASEYKTIGIILFAFSVLFSAIVNFKVALLLIAYQALAWIYSAWPLRFKRFAYLASFVSAVATLLILISGFILVSSDQNISRLPFSIAALLVVGLTLSLPAKDFKDVRGDRQEGVWTIPVIFGEYWGKVIVGSGIFISFISSVILLNEFRLFWWAILLGGASFWTVVNMRSDSSARINSRNVIWWILSWIIIYLLILTKIILEGKV